MVFKNIYTGKTVTIKNPVKVPDRYGYYLWFDKDSDIDLSDHIPLDDYVWYNQPETEL